MSDRIIPPMIEVPDDAEAFWALFADELAKPLPPIPLADTPIYTELKAEHDGARRQAIEIATIAYTGAGPLLKNGRKP